MNPENPWSEVGNPGRQQMPFQRVSVWKEGPHCVGGRRDTLRPKSQDTMDIAARIWSKRDKAVIVVP